LVPAAPALPANPSCQQDLVGHQYH
jgi:hypothetical protein